MPLIARGKGQDNVTTLHGIPDGNAKCTVHSTQQTWECSRTVLIGGVGVVRLGDAMAGHPDSNCVPHFPILNSGSATVFADGLPVGLDEGTYDLAGHTLDVVSQTTVYAG